MHTLPIQYYDRYKRCNKNDALMAPLALKLITKRTLNFHVISRYVSAEINETGRDTHQVKYRLPHFL